MLEGMTKASMRPRPVPRTTITLVTDFVSAGCPVQRGTSKVPSCCRMGHGDHWIEAESSVPYTATRALPCLGNVPLHVWVSNDVGGENSIGQMQVVLAKARVFAPHTVYCPDG